MERPTRIAFAAIVGALGAIAWFTVLRHTTAQGTPAAAATQAPSTDQFTNSLNEITGEEAAIAKRDIEVSAATILKPHPTRQDEQAYAVQLLHESVQWQAIAQRYEGLKAAKWEKIRNYHVDHAMNQAKTDRAWSDALMHGDKDAADRAVEDGRKRDQDLDQSMARSGVSRS